KRTNETLTAPTRNWRFSAPHDSFVVAQTFVLRMNICGKNRQLLVAANRQAVKKPLFSFILRNSTIFKTDFRCLFAF
ncbi:MAG: hypothetical protein ACK5D8_07645, partial [Bacteroidota bacterium]